MTKQNSDINNLRVASPCSVGWETMSGDERVRRCASCELNIYNISEMKSEEVENLILKCEGRICVRLYKRADGTVLTKDCPVGFRAYQKRAARFAGAALATIFGLFSVSFGQKETEKSIDASKIKVVRKINQNRESILSGRIFDPTGAVVAGAELKLYEKTSKDFLRINSDEDGNYIFKSLTKGSYILEVQAQGFKKYKLINLAVKDNQKISINIKLRPDTGTYKVGLLQR